MKRNRRQGRGEDTKRSPNKKENEKKRRLWGINSKEGVLREKRNSRRGEISRRGKDNHHPGNPARGWEKLEGTEIDRGPERIQKKKNTGRKK